MKCCFIFHFISCFFTLSFLPFYISKSNICIPFSLQLWVIYYFPVLLKLLYVLCMSPFTVLLILLDFWTLTLHSFPPLCLVICVLKLENIKISVLYIWYLFTVYMFILYFLCIFMFHSEIFFLLFQENSLTFLYTNNFCWLIFNVLKFHWFITLCFMHTLYSISTSVYTIFCT